jgi:enediyne biosynthesis protein E4
MDSVFARMSLPVVVCLCLALPSLTAQRQSQVRVVTWDDVAAVGPVLEAGGLTAAGFSDYVQRVRQANARRVREGDLDHLIFYLLQSTRFTKLPPIEPAIIAKALVESRTNEIPAAVRARASALLRALDSGDRDPRLVYFRELVNAAFPQRGSREAALLREYVRVMRFVYEKEFVAQRAEQRSAAVAELYRTRGLSTDTAVEAGFLVHQALGVLRSLEPLRRIRRVLIVGPGLDLAPRTSLDEAGPPQSYQPWAVMDALISLGLSGLDDLEVVAADINPRVVTHLRRQRTAPPSLTLVSEIRESDTVALSADYREYFQRLGAAIAVPSSRPSIAVAPVPGGHLAKTVPVADAAARALRAEALDIITERLDGPSFDVIVATNILPYFDDPQLALAMVNIASMLAPGGAFLHNEGRASMGALTSAIGLPLEHSRHAIIASVRNAPPLVDNVWLHRKSAGPGVKGEGSRVKGEGSGVKGEELGFSFTNIAQQAGLHARTIYGAQGTNKYLIETTGTGVAVLDYDGDGWMDIFLVNGTVLEGFPKGQEPTNHLYRNRRDGTFEDVTARAGLAHGGWGQAACAGDFDNDGHEDLFVSYWGQNRLYRNRGGATFDDVTSSAGLTQDRRRWGSGCAFLDYDRDGRLDLMVANYIDFNPATTPLPESGLCRYKGLPVACGPSGLPGGTNALYHNRGDGTFRDVSVPSGIAAAKGTYGLGVSTLDFDDDGWVDLYVANDSSPSALYRNNRNGTFTDIGTLAGCAFNQDGRPQAGMGVAVADYDRNGTMDIVKTNFAGDTSTLYANSGSGFCDDKTFASGIGVNTRWLGWGVGFLDLDHDGWQDLFLVNGHVYPEVDRLKSEAAYKQPKVVYQNLRNGRFSDITARLGPPVTAPKAARGAAFADFDNDGDVDVVVNNLHDTPDLFRLDQPRRNHWLTLKLVGTKSNRSAIGALARVIARDGEQRQEVRGGGSYYSQNDLRLHFGLGESSDVRRVVVRWPTGVEEEWTGLATNTAHTLREGSGR